MALELRHAIRPVITLAAVGASIALVACGGDSEASGEEEQQANFEDAQVEFAECMRENGVNMPDPDPDGGFQIEQGENGIDPQSDEFQAAQEKCGSILDEAVPEGERPDPAEMRDRLHQMTECLRDKGYDVPEPTIVGPGEEPPDEPQGGSGEFREELERLEDDPEFQQAQEDCSEEAGLGDVGGGGIRIGGPAGGDGGE